MRVYRHSPVRPDIINIVVNSRKERGRRIVTNLSQYFDISTIMEISIAINALSALAQTTRLLVFKKLVEYGSAGLRAGDIARELEIPANTLSFHLSHLENAGLVVSRRDGRNIFYAFNREAMNELIGFLNENCCAKDGAANNCLVAQNNFCEV